MIRYAIIEEDTLEEILKLIASFLGGALVAAVSFMFAFVSRLTSVETEVRNLGKQITQHVETGPGICSFHSNIMERLSKVETQVEERK